MAGTLPTRTGCRMDRLITRRTADRLRTARLRVARLVEAAAGEPFAFAVIGSLASGRFGLHSDVDLLVRGEIDTTARVRVEQLVAAAMRGSGIRYDLIFACDLTPARLREFEHDLVEPSGLRKAGAKAGAGAARADEPR